MRKPFTQFCKLALGALALGLAVPAHAAPVPVAVAGYTADVVAEGTGTALSRISLDFDAAGYTLMAVGYTNPTGAVATVGLPATGLVSSAATSGLTFQLAAYSANNSLRLAAAGTGTLTLATPRTAGDVYVLASSGSGISTVGMTVTFTDGTTQVFAASSVPDWFGGTPVAVTGIGRVSTSDNIIQNTATDPRLYEYRLTLAAANLSKLVQSVSFNKTSATGVLNVMGISVNPVCSSAPTAGTAVASATNTCAASGIVVSLTGASADGGVAYQWQASINGGTTFIDIAGATSPTYTVAGQTVTTQYRARLTCSSTSQTANSAAVTISATSPTYAALPIIESFENTWLSVCNTRDVPNASWRNAPATGNNSWRRDDDGAVAVWTSPTTGSYTPVSSQGTHSARFHSYYASSGAIGTLDLYVNLSAAGAKRLSFDFVNTSGADSLVVQLSTDGGATFARLAGYKLSATFTTQVLPISATSATSVVRFRGRSDFGATDIGLDNIILESATGCLTPASLTATTTTTTAALTWLTGGPGTYTVVYGPNGFNPATSGTTLTGVVAPPTAIAGLTPGTTYQFYVTQNCTAGTSSGTAGPGSFTTQIVNDDPCGAAVLTITNTCTPLATTSFGANTTASTVYTAAGQGAGCGSIAAPHDVWFTFTTAATGPTSTQVRISVTGGAASVVRAYSGAACTGSLTFLSCAGTASNTAAPNLDLTGLTPSTTYYVRVNEYSTTGTLGNFTICATPVPNCPAPAGLAAGTLTNTTANVSWAATSGGTGSTYTVVYGPTGFAPATGGTSLTGLTATSATLTGLSAITTYQFYVQQVCGGFNGSSTLTGPISFTTPLTAPANDEPCGALALGTAALTGSNVGSTTSLQNGITLPACTSAAAPKDVWFTFTATGATATLTLTGAAAGMVRVFTSPSCSVGPFASVFCLSSAASNTAFAAPVAVTGLTAGTRYYLAVSGYGSSDLAGVFTLTGTGLATGTKAQAETNALVVYPNPTSSGQLTLRLNGINGASQATLINALGQLVRTLALPGGTTEHLLGTRGLAAGIYTLRIAAGLEVFTRKVVLE